MTEPTTITELKFNVFHLGIVEIFRAIQGHGCRFGAFTLGMCAIDAMAFLAFANNENFEKDTEEPGRQGFVTWVKENMPNYNCTVGKYPKSEVLHRLRCGLVHAMGYPAEREKKKGTPKKKKGTPIDIKAWRYTHDEPDAHWSTFNNQEGYVLNLDSFLAELTIGGYVFFKRLEEKEQQDPSHVQYILRENAPKISYVCIGKDRKYKNISRFAEIPINISDPPSEQEVALQEVLEYLDADDFDPNDTEKLTDKIRKMYPPKPENRERKTRTEQNTGPFSDQSSLYTGR